MAEDPLLTAANGHLWVAADVADEAQMAAAFQQIAAQYGRLDALAARASLQPESLKPPLLSTRWGSGQPDAFPAFFPPRPVTQRAMYFCFGRCQSGLKPGNTVKKWVPSRNC